MSKTKTLFFCKNCGVESVKWIGKCPNCHQWNTYIEKIITASSKEKSGYDFSKENNQPLKIIEIEDKVDERIDCLDRELNQVLGGGMVKGSLLLLAGEPGIGKSTLALQLALKMNSISVVYVSGEESLHQLKMRTIRIGISNDDIWLVNETKIENIFLHFEKIKPQFIVIDSIQTIYTQTIENSAGTVPQIKECAVQFLQYAKSKNIPILIIGHITKDGQIAGPKILEHIVDVVLQLEADDQFFYRILRANKNRYGSTDEMGMYEMQKKGMFPVNNFSSLLLPERNEQLSGNAVAVAIEGIRPIMIEVQALVGPSFYGTPQRSTTGFHYKRLNMLLAVIESKTGYKLGNKDVFLNIAGGINVKDTAIDMAVIVAILSASLNLAISSQICFFGEVGLSGEIRPNKRLNIRIKEASKLGFKKIFCPFGKLDIPKNTSIEIVKISKITDVLKKIFK